MKNFFLFSMMLTLYVGLSAQTVTLTFTAQDGANHYLKLNRVVITNLTKSWQETIWYPDTVLTMQNGTDIDVHVGTDCFALSQNTPNPFSSTTNVTLTVSEEGAVNLDIADVNGRIVQTQNLVSLHPGNHQFQIALSTPGIHVMTARQNGKTSSIKMICNDGGNSNTIDYLGELQKYTYVLKSSTDKPFNFGDMMEYVGYASINGTMEESQRISQAQGSSQSFTLQFSGTQILYELPTVNTSTVSDITYTFARCGGTVVGDGGTTVTARGVCWSTSQNPTISNTHTTDGTGTGSFYSDITGLISGTTYYVRAYATNSMGTAYGTQRTFTTPANLPTVTTGEISNVTTTSATCGGNVTSNGGVPITARGLCWSTSQNPTVSGNHTTNGSGTGTFTGNITGLTANTVYFVRAYATNSVGTAYGEQRQFAAAGGGNDGQPCPMASVTDYDGNTYNTVQIGNQCWMKENLKTTHFADGTYIPLGNTSSTSSPSRCEPYTSGCIFPPGFFVNAYGYLYNGTAATYGGSDWPNSPNIQGACPDGWHLPRDSEWVQLMNYVSCHSQYLCSNITENIAKALSSTTGEDFYGLGWYGWETNNNIPCSIGNILSDNNATGFSAMPAGDASGGISGGATHSAVFWSSTPPMGVGVGYYTYHLDYNNAYVERILYPSDDYCSIRCLNDNGTVTTLPTVTTTPCNSITATSVVSGGIISSSGNASVTSRGVCWSTSQNPTVSGNHTSNGSGTGTFTSSITGLTAGTTYYVRAYATNSAGTAYGAQQTFTTLSTPMVTTNIVSNIAVTSATCGGNVTSEGGASVTVRGVCWSTSQNPTVSGNHTTDGSGAGNFSSNISELAANTTYYVRAYATNSAGTTYGEQRNFTTLLTTPTITTNTISDITSTTATSGGIVTTNGGDTVTARGVCWSTFQNPTVSDSHTIDGSGTGSFISSIAGLAANTTYYVRAYATNSAGTAYGEQKTFTTTAPDWLTCPSTPTITDIDGNVYNTVQIGQQCWMKENLRTTHYANGDIIPIGGSSSSTSNPYYYDYSSSSFSLSQRGYLYNWPAVMHGASYSNANPSGIQGVCPNGWHVPSEAEWTQLIDYVKSQNQYICGNNSDNNIAKALASTTGWNTSSNNCAVGNNQSANNATGFSAVPTGYRSTSFSGSGIHTYFWTTTYGNHHRKYKYISYSNSFVGGDTRPEEYGHSIRCVHDSSFATPPTVTTMLVTDVTLSNATCGGTVTADGGASVTARGVCWSTSQNPTVSCDHTTDGTGTGSFTSSITGLAANTIYYVRAYATNSAGTAYGEQRSFITYPPTVTTNTVSNITVTTATCGGNVTSTGGTNVTCTNVTARGVCWSTSPNPTISDNHTNDGTGLGTFTSYLTGLTGGTTYHVRAYVTSTEGTTYGNEISFTTTVPDGYPCYGTSTMTDIDNNTYSTVKIGDQCWMKENLRTTRYTNGMIIPLSSGDSDTTAYRAYPNNDGSIVSSYGYLYNWSAVMQNTPSSSNNPSGVQGICPIGWHVPSDAEWTQLTNYVSANITSCVAKALASKTGWTGSSTNSCAVGNNPNSNNASGFSGLPAGHYTSSCYDFGHSARFWSATDSYGSSSALYRELFYNNSSVLGTNTANYKGWGNSVRCLRDTCTCFSSQTELNVITGEITNISTDSATGGGYVTSDGGASVTARGVCWGSLQNPTLNNNHTSEGTGTGYFSCNLTGLTAGTTYYVRAYATNSTGTVYGQQISFTALANLPVVSTSIVTNITDNAASCGGNVTSNGGDTVTARGVCWSISQNPTVNDIHTVDGSGMGSFTSSITGLTAEITYYMRAYATNIAGTAYGEQRSFTTSPASSFICGTSTVSDYDCNTYNTVQIGQQCWMKENLRTTHYADGTSIPAGGSNTSYTSPYYYDYSSSGIDLTSRGYLYNWPAVMHDAASSNTNPSGVQGICPVGWHLPSDSEWTQLTDYVSSQTQYVCGSVNTYIAKALASNTNWSTSTTSCAVGNNQPANNATGFSAFPVGKRSGSSFGYAGDITDFWSSRSYGSDAYSVGMNYNSYFFSGGTGSKNYGRSVRCLKD